VESQQGAQRAHLFVCTVANEKGEGCGAQGGTTLVDGLKAWVKEAQLRDRIQVTRSGCLGHCQKAVAAVCYPHGQWLTELATNDIEALKAQLLAAAPPAAD
jgi:predicted metal-binding protein